MEVRNIKRREFERKKKGRWRKKKVKEWECSCKKWEKLSFIHSFIRLQSIGGSFNEMVVWSVRSCEALRRFFSRLFPAASPLLLFAFATIPVTSHLCQAHMAFFPSLQETECTTCYSTLCTAAIRASWVHLTLAISWTGQDPSGSKFSVYFFFFFFGKFEKSSDVPF